MVDTTKLWDISHTQGLMFDGVKCSNMKNRLDFIVYDNKQKVIVDKVNFDTPLADIPESRN